MLAVPVGGLARIDAGRLVPSDEVDAVLEATGVHVAADPDQGPARERLNPAQRLAAIGQAQVCALLVAGLPLASELLAPGVERRALLPRPGAGAVITPEVALGVEHRIAGGANVEPDRVGGLDPQLLRLVLGHEVDVVGDVDDIGLGDRRVDYVQELPLVGRAYGHAVALRERSDRLLLPSGEEGPAAVRGLREPRAVVQVDLLDRRHRSVGAHQVRLEAGDVAVLERLLDRHRSNQDVVLAGLHDDRAVREAQPLTGAGIAFVIGALPPLLPVEALLVAVVPVVGARPRQDGAADVRVRKRWGARAGACGCARQSRHGDHGDDQRAHPLRPPGPAPPCATSNYGTSNGGISHRCRRTRHRAWPPRKPRCCYLRSSMLRVGGDDRWAR